MYTCAPILGRMRPAGMHSDMCTAEEAGRTHAEVGDVCAVETIKAYTTAKGESRKSMNAERGVLQSEGAEGGVGRVLHWEEAADICSIPSSATNLQHDLGQVVSLSHLFSALSIYDVSYLVRWSRQV